MSLLVNVTRLPISLLALSSVMTAEYLFFGDLMLMMFILLVLICFFVCDTKGSKNI
jgi:hypothetical protein